MRRMACFGVFLACTGDATATGSDAGDTTASTTTGTTTGGPGTTSLPSSSSTSSTSGTGGTADDTSSGDTGEALPECPMFEAGANLGVVGDAAIVETSGLVASRAHADVLWLHNDSGDGARAFAIGTDGAVLGQISIGGALALDWEDAALGPGPDAGVDYLYFGDIGDNLMFRAFITAYRVAEPDPRRLGGQVTATALNLHFPDGSHDAEALMSDPWTGDLYVVSKVDSGQSGVYRAAFPQSVGMTNELELVASITFGVDPLPGSPLVTAGDIAADGSLVVLRTYSSVFGWRRGADMTIGEAFATEPCPLPAMDEPGGEAIAVGAGGYYTISEGAMIPVWYFAGA
ncbi:MAG: hypothetical protein JNK45_12585 [Myxococcales bacterium]|nr:hypothetical protein [Myxococcales bacterium]